MSTVKSYKTNSPNRSVEKGTSILPPFETPVGRVGMMICFDVRTIPHICKTIPSSLILCTREKKASAKHNNTNHPHHSSAFPKSHSPSSAKMPKS